MSGPILEVHDLRVQFGRPARFGRNHDAVVHAVDSVSFSLEAGTTLGIVGESGSGKSTLARAIAGLIAPTSGEVLFDGRPVPPGRPIGRDVHMVFQDPFGSLDPRLSVGASIAEPIVSHLPELSGRQVDARVAELLTAVQLPPSIAGRLPRSMSGGQLQRVGIARAIAAEPRLVIADEPVSALDVSVQGQILNLFDDLQRRLGVAYLFIGHNLAVVERVADQIAVMYRGSVVETGDARQIIGEPSHPYTQALVAAVPRIEAGEAGTRSAVAVDPAGRRPVHAGCQYASRCALATDLCRRERPRLRPGASSLQLACHHVA